MQAKMAAAGWKETKRGLQGSCWAHHNVSWDPNTKDSRRIEGVSKENSV